MLLGARVREVLGKTRQCLTINGSAGITCSWRSHCQSAIT